MPSKLAPRDWPKLKHRGMPTTKPALPNCKRRDKETHFQRQAFLLDHELPNVYFHLTTAYAILRHNGVAIGKRDVLGTC